MQTEDNMERVAIKGDTSARILTRSCEGPHDVIMSSPLTVTFTSKISLFNLLLVDIIDN